MSEDEDLARKRRRQREDERDAQELELKRARKLPGGTMLPTDIKDLGKHVVELIDRGTSMIDQLDSLYNQFRAGLEKRPPVERRKQLDQIMLSLTHVSMPNASLLFRYRALLDNYGVHCERWDKLVRKIEALQATKPLIGNPLAAKKPSRF